MTMIEVVAQLQSQGHEIDFYVRKDGGILVKNIDGKHFPSGASGNAVARQMAGASISEARISQLKFATRARKVKKPSPEDAVYKEWKRVKEKWNKAFKAKHGKPHPAGYFGWKRIEYALKQGGKEEALKVIARAERYASGIAYAKNVEHLAGYIKDASAKYGSQELSKLADDIIEESYNIKEEWIYPAYQELYKLNAGYEPQYVAKNVRRILRLSDAS